jgi:hypothetical protein
VRAHDFVVLDARADAVQVVALADVDRSPAPRVRQQAVLDDLALVVADGDERTALCLGRSAAEARALPVDLDIAQGDAGASTTVTPEGRPAGQSVTLRQAAQDWP